MNKENLKQIIFYRIFQSFFYLICCCAFVVCLNACDNNTKAGAEIDKENDRLKIEGTFTELPNTPVRINISKGFAAAPIHGDTTDVNGKFTLYYPLDYKGIGTIEIYRGAKVPIILNGKDVEFTAPNAESIAAFNFNNSSENELFKKYLTTESIWLTTMVQTENYKPVDKDYVLAKELRAKAITNIEQLISSSSPGYYLKSYLPLRYKIQQMRIASQLNSFKNEEYLNVFKTIDLNSDGVEGCACSEDIVTNAYQLVESMPTDNSSKAVNSITDHIMNQVSTDEDQFILAGTFIYNMFETKKNSNANEHLSLLILEGDGCAIDDSKDVTRRFEQYRKMKIGNVAPDIQINESQSLYQLENKNKLVVFWASWCAHCMQEIPQLVKIYPQLKAKGTEVISISLDTDENEYNKVAQNHSWLKYCDFKKWETQAAKDYYISTTPALFILNAENKIIEKPSGFFETKRFFNL